jgi:hypothetical protein
LTNGSPEPTNQSKNAKSNRHVAKRKPIDSIKEHHEDEGMLESHSPIATLIPKLFRSSLCRFYRSEHSNHFVLYLLYTLRYFGFFFNLIVFFRHFSKFMQRGEEAALRDQLRQERESSMREAQWIADSSAMKSYVIENKRFFF